MNAPLDLSLAAVWDEKSYPIEREDKINVLKKHGVGLVRHLPDGTSHYHTLEWAEAAIEIGNSPEERRAGALAALAAMAPMLHEEMRGSFKGRLGRIGLMARVRLDELNLSDPPRQAGSAYRFLEEGKKLLKFNTRKNKIMAARACLLEALRRDAHNEGIARPLIRGTGFAKVAVNDGPHQRGDVLPAMTEPNSLSYYELALMDLAAGRIHFAHNIMEQYLDTPAFNAPDALHPKPMLWARLMLFLDRVAPRKGPSYRAVFAERPLFHKRLRELDNTQPHRYITALGNLVRKHIENPQP